MACTCQECEQPDPWKITACKKEICNECTPAGPKAFACGPPSDCQICGRDDADRNAKKMQLRVMTDLPEWAVRKRSFLPNDLELCQLRPPWRFQWIIKRKLALMAWPQYPEHLRYLLKNGIRRLVSLSKECRPPVHMFTEFYWMELPFEELEPPTMNQIKLFICFCENARQVDEPVGVHCRVGRGRSGTLAACYLVRFCGLTAEMAIMQLRKVRPDSINTMAQEAAIKEYYEELCRCPPNDDCWQPSGL